MKLVCGTLFTAEVEYIFRKLLSDGDEIRLVGGCLRDFLLGDGREINDYDFATRYQPMELARILDKNGIEHVDVNSRFGTIVAFVNGKKFEITSLRKDVETDGRHATVEFTDDYREDAKRRDFTFNAIYCDGEGEIYDYFSGIVDLNKRLVRFIGDPEQRILEDHLRILRFFRFYSTHGFFMDYRSLMACKKYSHRIKKLSRERVTDELRKILESGYPLKTLKVMEHHGILQNTLNYSGKLDFANLDIFFAIGKKFKYNYIFILTLILSKNKIDLNLTLRRKEKMYISSILNNIPTNISPFEIKKLLFTLKDVNKVRDIAMIYICNNYSPNILEYLDLVVETSIPNLKVNSEMLERHGFTDKKNYGRLLAMAKCIFVESAFEVDGDNLVDRLKTKLATPGRFSGKTGEK
ncbi:MAG: CCA tRNA nucleotidyltransferase [Rickettsiales bacterium]|nr:CCA tRNA nucleotidyltransferase [Rickettsiales bacterium]